MKNLKFIIHSPEHSAAIQKRLFELGYNWRNFEHKKSVRNIDAIYLFADGNGGLAFGNLNSTYENSVGTPTTLDDLYKPKPEIIVEGKAVEFFNNGVKINSDYTYERGCSIFVHKDDLKRIYDRMMEE